MQAEAASRCPFTAQRRERPPLRAPGGHGPGHPQRSTAAPGWSVDTKRRDKQSHLAGRHTGDSQQAVPGGPEPSKGCLFHSLLFPWIFKANNTQRVVRNPPLQQEHRGAAAPRKSFADATLSLTDRSATRRRRRTLKHGEGPGKQLTLTCHPGNWQETIELARRHFSGASLIPSRSGGRTIIRMESD